MTSDDDQLRRGTAKRFLSLMRRYVAEYVNLQRPITEELMVPDYYLRAGDIVLRRRAEEYVPMVKPLLERFPQLTITVHDVVINGNRFAMHYSELAREAQSGHAAVWGGIGLYKWDGTRLTHNVTEQDWVGRERQLASGQPDRVPGAAISPWETEVRPENPESEAIVRVWLASGALTTTKGVLVDDEFSGHAPPRILQQKSFVEIDLFSAGSVVAFYIEQKGRLLSDLGCDARHVGREVKLSVAGIVHVADGVITQGMVVRNKAGLLEALQKA